MLKLGLQFFGGRGSSGGKTQNSVSKISIETALDRLMRETGTNHNGGDCAITAKSIGLWLEENGVKRSDYSFAGVLFTDGEMTGITHILVKYKGNYYDGVEGLVDTSNMKIVDNIQDDGSSLGNDKYGWIDYYSEKYVRNWDTYKALRKGN